MFYSSAQKRTAVRDNTNGTPAEPFVFDYTLEIIQLAAEFLFGE